MEYTIKCEPYYIKFWSFAARIVIHKTKKSSLTIKNVHKESILDILDYEDYPDHCFIYIFHKSTDLESQLNSRRDELYEETAINSKLYKNSITNLLKNVKNSGVCVAHLEDIFDPNLLHASFISGYKSKDGVYFFKDRYGVASEDLIKKDIPVLEDGYFHLLLIPKRSMSQLSKKTNKKDKELDKQPDTKKKRKNWIDIIFRRNR